MLKPEEVIEKVKGLTEHEANSFVLLNQYIPRPINVDDLLQPMTSEYRIDRINLVLKNGIVIAAHIG